MDRVGDAQGKSLKWFMDRGWMITHAEQMRHAYVAIFKHAMNDMAVACGCAWMAALSTSWMLPLRKHSHR